ncbi:hypothetical protein [Synechococcus sp. CBW1006]|uniref:hypothetical protein n=1 Tax=Synechococcus sp. CBW1006 TaxID=1353138 RepID=UPI0018CED6E4|nr:hypothetical protein [Synechococcus sp. CBW1006]QPN66570.1 hypothetical protein H8F26_17905 [Synechococcus sp. CBW1006]
MLTIESRGVSMGKRQLLLGFLRKILLGEKTEEAPVSRSVPSAIPVQPASSFQAMPSSAALLSEEIAASAPASKASSTTATHISMPEGFPVVSAEIRDLLASADWEEVNQGLELLASIHGAEQLAIFAALIDPAGLQIRDRDRWASVLGISELHTLNAVAKLAGISGALSGIRSITIQRSTFAESELHLDLSLLAEAEVLEQLFVNGPELSSLSFLSGLQCLKKLVLISDSVDWDSDEDAGCFDSLRQLQFLAVSNWPWEDLSALEQCKALEHLELRGGELEGLKGIEDLKGLRSLSLSDFNSLSDLDGLEALSNIQKLSLRSLSVDAIEAVTELRQLESFVLEASEAVDVTPLGQLPTLHSVDIDCSEGTGFGALVGCPKLTEVKLGLVPDHVCGDSSRCRLGISEFETLMTTWKAVNVSSRKVCRTFAGSDDIGVFLLGLNLLECVSTQISVEQLRQRLDLLSLCYGDQLRSRCYWPVAAGGGEGFSQSHPVGQWMDRSRRAGGLTAEACMELSAVLAEYLPTIPQR